MTAEAATALPVLVVVAVALAWLVGLGVTQVRAVDAAREAARSLARGESAGTATSLARRVATPGSVVRVSPAGQEVTVRVTSHVRGPGWLLGGLPSVDLHGEAVAAREPGTGSPP
ncbi:MAG: hypothetical protein JWO46_486 [Nocardioidaceae bacterium]|nr:hypothetical protein [Nocardioidaceae bacterium]